MDVIDVLGEILADIEKQSADTFSSASENRASKQSINRSNGSNGTSATDTTSSSVAAAASTSATTTTTTKKTTNSVNSNSNATSTSTLQHNQQAPQPPQKSVRFTNSEEATATTSTTTMNNGNKSPIPSTKLLQPHHQQPLQIIVDTLQVPGDRSFLHSPTPDILAQNGTNGTNNGAVTPVPGLRTPSPGGTITSGRVSLNLTSNAPKSPKSPSATVLSKTTTGGWAPSPRHADASEGVPVFSLNDDNEDWNFQSYHLDYKYTPPPIKGPCCVCGDGIMGAMVTALDKMWHPEHFCCVHCGVELRSPNYTEHGGQPYCKTCHNMLFLPPCWGCKKNIDGKYIQPMGKVWHPDCFRCTKCSKVLSPENFFQKDGKPYCEDDYHDLFSPKCHGCKKPIKDDRKVTALGGKTWHPTCFKCCKCNCVLSPNNFRERDGKLYCEKDYNDLFMPKCTKCNTPILEKPTNAMGKTWHPKCFNCTECKKVLSPDNFLEKNGKPYCEDDYHKLFSPKCAGCKKPIKDPKRIVQAQGKPWHPEHFCCTECGKQLDPNKFWEKEGLPYCEDDFHKLFSPKCAGCRQPIKSKPLYAMGQYWHPDHFCCEVCGKQLHENEFYEKDGKAYCVDDYLNLFAPKCKQCRLPITDEYCLVALNGDWHANCFRCRDCNILLEDINFFEINGEPYCEQHFHARQCPDCIRIRRAQNKYFGIAEDAPMQVRKWASQVSLKSLELNQRPGSRMSQYSYTSSSYELGGRATPTNNQSSSARSSYIIPIEREGGGGGGGATTSSNGLYHIHDHNGTCLHDHELEETIQRSSAMSQHSSSSLAEQKSRSAALGGKSVGWKKSQDNMQYIAKNESPYIYNEPGKFPVLDPGKHIRFEEVVTKREYEAVSKHY